MTVSLGGRGEGGDSPSRNSDYRRPRDGIVSIVEAEPTPVVVISPNGRKLLFGHYEALPPIEQQAEPILGLAGVRFRPRLNEWHRAYYFTRLEVMDIESGARTWIEVPAGSKLGRPLFSSDATLIAFTRTVDDGVELWVAEVVSGRARRILPPRLNEVLGGSFGWIANTRELLVLLVPEGRPAPPTAPRVPKGPVIEDTAGRLATNRTFQDLLKNAHDEELFDHYCTSQLARVTLSSDFIGDAQIRSFGEPAIYIEASASPSGQYWLVCRILRPYSYSVPISRFSHTVEVWDGNGSIVREITRLPLAEEVPIQGVPKGMRAVHWQPHEPAMLCYVEALDGGDPKRAAEFRDELFCLDSPTAQPRSLGRTKERFIGLEWLEKKALYLVTEWDRDRKWVTTTLRDASTQDAPIRTIFDRSQNDRYGDPGEPVMRRNAQNALVVRMEGDAIFLAGEGATPEGDLPFLDRLDLVTLKKDRLFQSERERFTSFVQFAPDADGRLTRYIVRRESPHEPPNYHLRERDETALARERAITSFPDPHPQLTGIEKELLTYRRKDGVTLSGTLYLPPDHREGQVHPLVIWAYPLEYNDVHTAGQVNAAPNRFTRLSGISPLFFLLEGFAVLDEATVPIVGDPETVNDTFIAQCVDSAAAAIDAVCARGVADRHRVAVGGHSYGAFMTAQLLAHCDLFKAGIARSGAFNRTLTPFGFQGERRTLWEAKSTYLAMSPLLDADKIKAPLLLIHGDIDDNPGTHTLQTRRLFHALSGLGATARMVILPHEAHGYVAKESVLHVLAESIDWLAKYV